MTLKKNRLFSPVTEQLILWRFGALRIIDLYPKLLLSYDVFILIWLVKYSFKKLSNNLSFLELAVPGGNTP